MNRKIKLLFYPLFIFLSFLMIQGCFREKVTLESLLEEMIDRDRIARIPSPFFTTRQFSSYDRESICPDSSGWFANWDRTHFLRHEKNNGRNEYVMMDAEGPGAIVRFWMTFGGGINSGQGLIRIYFDNDHNPVIEGRASELLSGGLLVDEPLASSVSRIEAYETYGHNLYLPLPYSKHCKVTYESDRITTPGNYDRTGETVYYNINYRTYTRGTIVTTFTQEILERASGTIENVQQKLKERTQGIDRTGLQTNKIYDKLSSEEAWSCEFSGSKAIREISLRLDAKDLNRALRTTIIEIEFDGRNMVWCPAGDFFGTGYQIRTSNTWFSQVTQDQSMSTFWVMPFKNKCTFKILNIGSEEVIISGNVSISKWKWDKRSMHFGASWHQYTKIFTGSTRTMISETKPDAPFDINYVELSGQGSYVGDALVLFNTAYGWWGEGDEKIYVDREEFPSHFGTGTEDYYGYAFGGRSVKFSNHPFIAQPEETGNSKPGYVVNIRHRALDAIPFKKHFKFDMELFHHQPTYINYAPTCFYYLKPGGRSNIEPDFEGARANIALQSTDIISNMVKNGKVEAEKMAFSNSSENRRGGMIIRQFEKVKLSNNLHVIWPNCNPGDIITFKFNSSEEGMFDITAVCNSGPEFGTFKCTINGILVMTTIDLLTPEPGERKISLGNRLIRKGENRIDFEVIKSNRKSHVFALDCILIK